MVMLFRFNSYQGSVWFSSANAVSGKVYEWDSKIETFFTLSSVNQELTERNLYLEQEVRKLHEQLGDSAVSKDTLRTKQLAKFVGYKLISAKVISNTLDRTENFITIDKGEAEGVKKDMGVVCGNGVVGIVYLASSHYSIVIPVLNSQSNISCVIQNRGYFGYLRWNGGSTNEAYVENVPRHAHFKLYDYVVTSGYSSVFPPGVAAGRILHVYNSADGLSYRLKVKLAVDFGTLRDVCVVDNSKIEERIKLLHAAQDSIKSREGNNK
jgi:rod shape-determining protein MreC